MTYKLKTDKVDAQPDQAQDLSRTSPSGKEKVHDVLFWSTTELTDVGRLVSLTTNSNSENEQLEINTPILSPRFHKNMICKVSPFDFGIQQKSVLQRSILACQGIT